MHPIADEKVLFRSPDPKKIFAYTPWLCRVDAERLAASFDLSGPGIDEVTGPKSKVGDNAKGNQCRVMLSDDRGESWRETGRLPMLHARLFSAGDTLYLLGHGGKMLISRSTDRGESWSEPAVLDDRHHWHQSGCAIDYRHGRIYLVMERVVEGAPWPGVRPVLMSADVTTDLCCRENWRFSNELDIFELDKFPNLLGMPFFPNGFHRPDAPKDKRYSGLPGFLETNVVRLYDPNHLFFDPKDRTVLLVMRLNSNQSNLAAVARGVEKADGSLELSLLETPAGGPLLYTPMPGGQMKFHIVYDKVSRCYWSALTQTTDSYSRVDRLPESRFNLPYNQRNRLALYFSHNCFDWCFAGMIAHGRMDICSRHYASLLVDGDNLLVFSRSGDEEASSAHNGNILTLHRIGDFRRLIY
ncbi:MAG: sialidase family protein [Victivallaceae bacterium]